MMPYRVYVRDAVGTTIHMERFAEERMAELYMEVEKTSADVHEIELIDITGRSIKWQHSGLGDWERVEACP